VTRRLEETIEYHNNAEDTTFLENAFYILAFFTAENYWEIVVEMLFKLLYFNVAIKIYFNVAIKIYFNVAIQIYFSVVIQMYLKEMLIFFLNAMMFVDLFVTIHRMMMETGSLVRSSKVLEQQLLWLPKRSSTTELLTLERKAKKSGWLAAIGREKFALVMTSFFDDFTVLTRTASAKHVSLVVANMFKKLGWQVATEPKKNVDFREVFDVLGVRFDLSKQHLGLISVQNKPTRAAELGMVLSEAMSRGSMSPHEAQSLRGRLIFAEQQTWGRNTRMALICVGDVAGEGPDQMALSEQLQAMDFLLKRVVHGPPRTVSIHRRQRFHLYIDGACEW
ncbi:unnamed protein product, partial [Symbiodinium sp. CCMP2456]